MSVSAFSAWWRGLSTGTKVGWIIVALQVLTVLLILWNTLASMQGVSTQGVSVTAF